MSEFNVIYQKFNDEIERHSSLTKPHGASTGPSGINNFTIPKLSELQKVSSKSKALKEPDDIFKAKRDLAKEKQQNKQRIDNLMNILGEELTKDEDKKEIHIPKLNLPFRPDDFPFDRKKRREAMLKQRRVNHFKHK